jgi:hypothetical protein
LQILEEELVDPGRDARNLDELSAGRAGRSGKSWPNPGRAGQVLEELAESW